MMYVQEKIAFPARCQPANALTTMHLDEFFFVFFDSQVCPQLILLLDALQKFHLF